MKARRITISTAIATALIALGSVAMAQSPGAGPGPGRGPGPHLGAAGPMAQPEAATARMKALEAELKLQPNQKAAFDAYAGKVQSEAEVRAKFHEGMQSRIGDPDAMRDYRVTIAKHHAEALGELNTLRKSLVAVLTPEQKQVLDRYGYRAGYGAGPRFGGMARGRGCGAWGA